MTTPQAPHLRDDGKLVRAARQRIENHFETKTNSCALAALRVVLEEGETEKQRTLRREHATLRAELNAAESKLAEMSEAVPALTARPGDVFFHPRHDGDEHADPDFVVYLGRADQLGGLFPSLMTEAERLAAWRRHIPESWITRKEHGRWLVFRHVYGDSMPLGRLGAAGGMFEHIDPNNEMPKRWFEYLRADMSCDPDTEFCLPPRFCSGFKWLNEPQEDFYNTYVDPSRDDLSDSDDADSHESF